VQREQLERLMLEQLHTGQTSWPPLSLREETNIDVSPEGLHASGQRFSLEMRVQMDEFALIRRNRSGTRRGIAERGNNLYVQYIRMVRAKLFPNRQTRELLTRVGFQKRH